MGYSRRSVDEAVGLGTEAKDLIARSIQVKHRKLKPDEIKRLVRHYQLGTCVSELAREFDVHRGTVHAHLVRAGVERRVVLPALGDEAADEAIELYERGLSLTVVGEKLGVSAGSAKRALIERGVRIRGRSERI